MSVENQRTDFIQGGLDRLDLVDDINAVRVIFNHSLDTPDVPLDVL